MKEKRDNDEKRDSRNITRREALKRGVMGGAGLFAGSLAAQELFIGGGTVTVNDQLQFTSGLGKAHGVVHQVADHNDPGGVGMADVAVTNGRDVVLTDAQGHWELPLLDAPHTTFSVIKPRGYMPPVDANQVPRFYYIHCPDGSPPLEYGGLDPTGPLPEEIRFTLAPQSEPDEFECALIGDPQSRNEREVRYMSHGMIDELQETNGAFGLVLGDIAFDRLNIFGPTAEVLGQAGFPMWYLFGNHDIDFDAGNNVHAADTYMRAFGPPYYAFNHGAVHFIVLNNVLYGGGGQPDYWGEVDARQLAFVENDLATVPTDQPIVLAAHIPLLSPDNDSPSRSTSNREALLQLFSNHDLRAVITAHRHSMQHVFHGAEQGWSGSSPLHEFIAPTACGQHWRGLPDELGIPHATMGDGAPRGFTRAFFDGGEYEYRFKATNRDARYQMNVLFPDAPDFAETRESDLYANVFMGSEHSEVRYRVLGETDWLPMDRIFEECPLYLRMRERSLDLEQPYLPQSAAQTCMHLWKAPLPGSLSSGHHQIEVETTDMFGHVDRAFQRIYYNA